MLIKLVHKYCICHQYRESYLLGFNGTNYNKICEKTYMYTFVVLSSYTKYSFHFIRIVTLMFQTPTSLIDGLFAIFGMRDCKVLNSVSISNFFFLLRECFVAFLKVLL